MSMIRWTMLMMGLLVCASAAMATEPVTKPAASPPSSESSDVGYHDLICKPNGTEDSFDCADEATPAKIVPIPSQMLFPRAQDLEIKG
jgi:hypothetical protein